jgi:hypothetical protein
VEKWVEAMERVVRDEEVSRGRILGVRKSGGGRRGEMRGRQGGGLEATRRIGQMTIRQRAAR